MSTFSGVCVFSATMREERASLGERITAWIKAKGDSISIVDIVQRQSSDLRFHMISITIFYNESGRARIDHVIKSPAKMDGATSRRLHFKSTIGDGT